MEVFVQGTDYTLYMKSFNPQTPGWGDWQQLGGILVASPGATARTIGSSNYVDVFVHGSDDALWWIELNVSSQSQSVPWTSLGGVLPQSMGPAASWDGSHLNVFVTGTDGALWWKSMTTGWSSWQSLGGVVTASPAATSPITNVIDVFVRGSDGALYQKEYSNGWGSWSSLGGVLASGTGPAACK
jgi:hypothetical protein